MGERLTIQGTAHGINLRGAVSMLVDYLEVKEVNTRLIRTLVDKINLAQIKLASDTRCLETFNESLVTVASTRSYTWGINDLFSIRHLYVDGYEVFPLTNGISDLDIKNDTESNRIYGYVFQGGIIYLEPIPSEELPVKLIYVRKPVVGDWETNDYLSFGDEYTNALLAYAYAIYFPPGSSKRINAMAEYENAMMDLRVYENLKESS